MCNPDIFKVTRYTVKQIEENYKTDIPKTTCMGNDRSSLNDV